MAGEMTCVNRDEWPIHQAVAEALGGQLRPFDAYQGPCILWQGRRLFIHHPEKMWRALILGEGWVYGIDDEAYAAEEVKEALQRHGVTHPHPSDFVAADDPSEYLMATDANSGTSTPTYPDTKDVARYLVDAIQGLEPSHV
jgi:hypothetical protein